MGNLKLQKGKTINDKEDNPKNKDKKNIKNFSIVMVGSTYAGKTALMNSLFENIFEDSILVTSAPNINQINLVMNDGEEIKFIIWDTPSFLHFEQLTINQLIKKKDIYIIVFDVKDQSRFDKVSFYLNEIKAVAKKNAPIILLGNKSEKDNKPREISREFAEEFALKNDLIYFEISAKAILDVKIIFLQIINYAYNKLTGKENSDEKKIGINEDNKIINKEDNKIINKENNSNNLELELLKKEEKIEELNNKIKSLESKLEKIIGENTQNQKKILELELLNENLTKKLNDLKQGLPDNKVKNYQNADNHNEIILKEKEKELNEQKNLNKILSQKIKNLQNNSMTNDNKENLYQLMEEIREKDKEIKELKSNLPFEISKGEKLMSVIFISFDQKIHYFVICKNTDKFNRLENVLYNVEEYKEYLNSENYFLLNGNKIINI